MPAKIRPVCTLALLLCGCVSVLLSVESTYNIQIGTHVGPSTGNYFRGDNALSDPSSQIFLKQIQLSDGVLSSLNEITNYSTFNGDRIELGFFDTDSSATITPNTDSSNPFTGTWTSLTSNLRIGFDDINTSAASYSNNFSDGNFSFKIRYTHDSTNALANEGRALINPDHGSSDDWGDTLSELSDTLDSFSASDYADTPDNDLSDRVAALHNSASDPLIGIRFYDQTDPGSQTTRYNTIMNAGWTFTDGETILLHIDDASSSSASGLLFEFDNTDANGAGTSKIGTHATNDAVPNDDFVATITYFDGNENIDVSNSGIGSTVFSGFDGTGLIYGGEHENVVTLHSQSGNTGASAFDFNGSFYRASSGTDSTDLTIIKTGAGDQILSGNINLADSNTNSVSGGLNITSGNLILKPLSGKTQVVDYLTGAGGLKLDNTGVSTDTIVTLGFANTSSSTFSGNVELSGGNTAHKISIASSATGYDKEQIIVGTITGDNPGKTLVKDGAGILTLHGDSSSSMDGGIQVENGTLVIGDGSDAGADPGSGTITINKGKLEIAASETIDNAINTGNSGKSMLGGKGTLDRAVTIGSDNDANYVDVISPGSGISSSLSSTSSKQQVSLGDRANAIGTFTVSDTLTFKGGGVYDWEINDFSGTAGTNWDLLKFDTLNFDSTSDVFTINIMSLDANGDAGQMSGGNVWDNYTSNGFKFMEATGTGSGWTGTGALTGDGYVSGFNVVDDGWSYYNQHWAHDWSVWYDHSESSFYLQYSVAPEPSTYVMVTGLMLVPGMNAVRKYRNRKKKQGQEEPEEEIVS
jgi:autotransporter-associated beta strand protein